MGARRPPGAAGGPLRRMQDPDFPEELHRLIEAAIPSVEAAELLLLLASRAERDFTAADLVHAIRPTRVDAATVGKTLEIFAARGLVETRPGGAVGYRPANPELESMVRALARAYNERPVTLIRAIYTSKLRLFADAFKIKKE